MVQHRFGLDARADDHRRVYPVFLISVVGSYCIYVFAQRGFNVSLGHRPGFVGQSD